MCTWVWSTVCDWVNVYITFYLAEALIRSDIQAATVYEYVQVCACAFLYVRIYVCSPELVWSMLDHPSFVPFWLLKVCRGVVCMSWNILADTMSGNSFSNREHIPFNRERSLWVSRNFASQLPGGGKFTRFQAGLVLFRDLTVKKAARAMPWKHFTKPLPSTQLLLGSSPMILSELCYRLWSPGMGQSEIHWFSFLTFSTLSLKCLSFDVIVFQMWLVIWWLLFMRDDEHGHYALWGTGSGECMWNCCHFMTTCTSGIRVTASWKY